MVADTEPATGELVSALDQGHVEFGIPGIPGGRVRIPLLDDAEQLRAEVVRGLKVAAYVREKYLGMFPDTEPPTNPEHASREDPPSRRQAPAGAVAFCPEHNNAPCRFSVGRYNKDGDRLYHALPESDWYQHEGKTVKNHNLYWRQTVDANGESNEGKLIPQGKA